MMTDKIPTMLTTTVALDSPNILEVVTSHYDFWTMVGGGMVVVSVVGLFLLAVESYFKWHKAMKK